MIANSGAAFLPKRLSLHAARSVAFQEGTDFVHRKAVEVAGYRMLQTTCRHREFESFAVAFERLQSINQPPGECVAASDPIHDMSNLVMPAEQKLFAVIQACRPAVVRRAS